MFTPKLQQIQFTNASGGSVTCVSIRAMFDVSKKLTLDQKRYISRCRRIRVAMSVIAKFVNLSMLKMRIIRSANILRKSAPSPFFATPSRNPQPPQHHHHQQAVTPATSTFMSGFKMALTSTKKTRRGNNSNVKNAGGVSFAPMSAISAKSKISSSRANLFGSGSLSSSNAGVLPSTPCDRSEAGGVNRDLKSLSLTYARTIDRKNREIDRERTAERGGKGEETDGGNDKGEGDVKIESKKSFGVIADHNKSSSASAPSRDPLGLCDDAYFAERCYVMVGVRETETSLMFKALMQLVRGEIQEEEEEEEEKGGNTRNDDKRRVDWDENAVGERHPAKTPALKRRISLVNADADGEDDDDDDDDDEEEEVDSAAARELFESSGSRHDNVSTLPVGSSGSRRRGLLAVIHSSCRVPDRHLSIGDPRNQYARAHRARKVLQLQLPIRSADAIRLPLPLPHVAKEWGLTTLLLRIGGENLMRVLHLMMLERSVLIAGSKVEEVSSCACALMQLLSPFKWAGTFVPLLPNDMMDFLLSPVPFVVGMVVDSFASVEDDPTLKEATDSGLSVIDLDSGEVAITKDDDVEAVLPLAGDIVVILGSLHCRLAAFAEREGNALGSLEEFVSRGPTNVEGLTIARLRGAIAAHVQSLGGEIAVGRNRWQKYGMLNRTSGEFEFYPSWFMEPYRTEMQFRERMVHTQLFVSFVDNKRREDMRVDGERTGRTGRFVATWLWFRWFVLKRRPGKKLYVC